MTNIKIYRNWGVIIGMMIPSYCFYVDGIEYTEKISLDGEFEVELTPGIHTFTIRKKKKRKSELVCEFDFSVTQEETTYYLVAKENLILVQLITWAFFLLSAFGVANNKNFSVENQTIKILLLLLLFFTMIFFGIATYVISFHLNRTGYGIRLTDQAFEDK